MKSVGADGGGASARVHAEKQEIGGYTIDSDVLPLGATNVIHEVRVSVCVGTLAGLTSLSLSLYPSLPGLL